MAKNYRYATVCIPDFAATSTPCSYGGEHALTRNPGKMPAIAEVRLNASLSGYGEAQFSFDSAFINGENQVSYNGASRVAEIGSWGVNINVNDSIEDGTAYAQSESAVFYWWQEDEIPEKESGTWSGSGTVKIANVRWKGTSSITITTEFGSESTVSVGLEPGISHTVTLSNGRSITTEVSDDMWEFNAHDSDSKSGSWSFTEELQCWVCKSALQDDLHEHYTLCYGCLETYPCFKHDDGHEWVYEDCPDGHAHYECDGSDHSLLATCSNCNEASVYKCAGHPDSCTASGSTDDSVGSNTESGSTSPTPSTPSPPSSSDSEDDGDSGTSSSNSVYATDGSYTLYAGDTHNATCTTIGPYQYVAWYVDDFLWETDDNPDGTNTEASFSYTFPDDASGTYTIKAEIQILSGGRYIESYTVTVQ
ncbi:MAG: hypothetical protein OXU23_22075 [Candidatus Poribacteria bacterium]|nr:hypothetical protein [Candidatus Poribacteria bacterium]